MIILNYIRKNPYGCEGKHKSGVWIYSAFISLSLTISWNPKLMSKGKKILMLILKY